VIWPEEDQVDLGSEEEEEPAPRPLKEQHWTTRASHQYFEEQKAGKRGPAKLD
jgi:hypothetical protein